MTEAKFPKSGARASRSLISRAATGIAGVGPAFSPEGRGSVREGARSGSIKGTVSVPDREGSFDGFRLETPTEGKGGRGIWRESKFILSMAVLETSLRPAGESAEGCWVISHFANHFF